MAAHKRARKQAQAEEPVGGGVWIAAWALLLVLFVVLGVLQARILLAGAGARAGVARAGLALNAAIVLLCLGQILRTRFRHTWRFLLPPSVLLLAVAFYFLLVRP